MQSNFAINLQVTTITGNSGVYFGNANHVVGLSTHYKINNGFGTTGSHNRVFRNLQMVNDADYMDIPIDDRDVHVFAPYYDQSPPHILNAHVESLNVETVQQNSGIFLGETNITGQDAHEKENIGTGNVFGVNTIHVKNVGIAYDPDTVDFYTDDRDSKNGFFLKPNEVVRVNTL